MQTEVSTNHPPNLSPAAAQLLNHFQHITVGSQAFSSTQAYTLLASPPLPTITEVKEPSMPFQPLLPTAAALQLPPANN